MLCPHHEDIKEIKKDVKQLLAFMHEHNGRDNSYAKISAVVSFLISSAIVLIASYWGK